MADRTQVELQADIDALMVPNAAGDVTVALQKTLLKNITESVDNRVDNVINVRTTADLPAAVGGVITLPATNTRYRFYVLLNIGSDRIVSPGDQTEFEGMAPGVGILSTTSLALVTTDKTMSFRRIVLVATSASKLIDAVDAGANSILLDSCGLVGSALTDLVCVDNYENFAATFCGFQVGNRAICFANAMTNIVVQLNQFEIGVTGRNIDLNGCLSEALSIDNNVSQLSATSTFLLAATNSANITATGGGTITHNKIDDSVEGSVVSVGLSPLDSRWLSIGNNNIKASDRVNPTGWAFYQDGDTVTQVVPAGEGSAIQFSVDGLGAKSNSDFAPRVVRGISEMWDTSADEMIPVTLGDSSSLRIAFDLTNKTGNPSIINFVFDIGGAVGITNAIYRHSEATPNTFPRTVTLIAPVFSLADFLANNGRIFMYTDSGTISVKARAVLIQRISSGAS